MVQRRETPCELWNTPPRGRGLQRVVVRRVALNVIRIEAQAAPGRIGVADRVFGPAELASASTRRL